MCISKIRPKRRRPGPDISSATRINEALAGMAITEVVRNQPRPGDGRAKVSGASRITKMRGLYRVGVRRQAGIVIAPGQQHTLSHASLNLTLQRIMIASEAAGGIFTGQLLTNTRLDVLTLA